MSRVADLLPGALDLDGTTLPPEKRQWILKGRDEGRALGRLAVFVVIDGEPTKHDYPRNAFGLPLKFAGRSIITEASGDNSRLVRRGVGSRTAAFDSTLGSGGIVDNIRTCGFPAIQDSRSGLAMAAFA